MLYATPFGHDVFMTLLALEAQCERHGADRFPLVYVDRLIAAWEDALEYGVNEGHLATLEIASRAARRLEAKPAYPR